MKKIILLAFVLMLLSIAVFVEFVTPAVAQKTIYIRSDGSVEGTDKIQRNGDVYALNADIYDEIVVERDNIVIDGANYTLQGTGALYSIGIYLSDRSGVIIQDMEIKAFMWGILLLNSSDNGIYRNNMTANQLMGGITLSHSSNNTIFGNTITHNRIGIRLDSSSNHNSISGNKIANNDAGIELDYSSSNSIYANNITANEYYGIVLFSSSSNSIYHNNFVDNTEQLLSHDSTNVWDGGAGKGNYWSDYEEKYPDAKEIDGSGIWDTPYVIDEYNQDNYPIVPEFPTWTSLLLTFIVVAVALAICKRRLLKNQSSELKNTIIVSHAHFHGSTFEVTAA